MTNENIPPEVVMEALNGLPVLGPDHRQAERVRKACHAVLARRQARAGARPVPRWMHALEPTLAAGFSVTFLADVVRRALALYGF